MWVWVGRELVNLARVEVVVLEGGTLIFEVADGPALAFDVGTEEKAWKEFEALIRFLARREGVVRVGPSEGEEEHAR